MIMILKPITLKIQFAWREQHLSDPRFRLATKGSKRNRGAERSQGLGGGRPPQAQTPAINQDFIY